MNHLFFVVIQIISHNNHSNNKRVKIPHNPASAFLGPIIYISLFGVRSSNQDIKRVSSGSFNRHLNEKFPWGNSLAIKEPINAKNLCLCLEEDLPSQCV